MWSDLSLIQFITHDTPVTAVTLVVFLDGAIKAFIPLFISIKIIGRINDSSRRELDRLYKILEQQY